MHEHPFKRLSRFRADDRGVAAIEFALVAPVLLLLILGSVTIYDAYRTAHTVEKASFTVADIISRRAEVDTGFFRDSYALFQNLLPQSAENPVLMVTSMIRGEERWEIDWSYVSTGGPGPSAETYESALPDVAAGDSVIIVEGSLTKAALSDILDITDFDHRTLTTVRPRFVSAIARTD